MNPSGRYRVCVFEDNLTMSLGTFATLTDTRAAQAVANGELARGAFIPPAQCREKIKAEREARRASDMEDPEEALAELAQAGPGCCATTGTP
ncbi:hypothetical protein [Micrococcus yunnanensis]|uniref:hypothetical protein n=1 Tax=Micrococcus yunnanensis TaxID=566027 RepID=UPI00107246A5|nr:hypothetical protein [Micrococcus yunnanensis]MCV7734121.1 hypothetical protein [Micrococcus luteus]TFU53991.1 hypothetical protein E4T95_09985 [Micrococcus yunnanensis]